MKKILAVLALMFSVSAMADPQTGESTGAVAERNFRFENEQKAVKILSDMTNQERLNLAQIYILNMFQKHCQTNDGKLFMLDIRYSENGTSSVVCADQLLAQVAMDGDYIKVRFAEVMVWHRQSHVQELCMFQPEKCTINQQQ